MSDSPQGAVVLTGSEVVFEDTAKVAQIMGGNHQDEDIGSVAKNCVCAVCLDFESGSHYVSSPRTHCRPDWP